MSQSTSTEPNPRPGVIMKPEDAAMPSAAEIVRKAQRVNQLPPVAKWQNALLIAVLVGGAGLLWLAFNAEFAPPAAAPVPPPLPPFEQPGEAAAAQIIPAAGPKTLKDIPFDGAKAYEYLKEICAIGPRVSATEGMAKQQKLITAHFEKLGAKVTRQEFMVRHPQTSEVVALANLVITWHPDKKERILFCTHYDTRPFPDRDPRNPKGVFLGANDGGSGVALLMELGKQMPQLTSPYGVDFVLFDGEELIFERDAPIDNYFLGAKHFAKEYAVNNLGYKYKWGILLDMVAGAALDLPVEATTWDFVAARPLVEQIWGTAKKLGVREFRDQLGEIKVEDDHIALNTIGNIPTIDIIQNFPWRYWHTVQDTPANCSALSLAKVGWVLHEWLKQVK